MSNETIYKCDFCGRVLNVNDIKWVEVTHRPPEWELWNRKCEDYTFCKRCYKEFLSIVRKRSSRGICSICIYAYCCNEHEKSNCDYINEKPPKRKWYRLWN